MEHAEFVQALRDAADFFEARPELGVPSCPEMTFSYAGDVDGVSVDSKAGLARFAELVGGKLEKEADDTFFNLIAKKKGFSVQAISYRSQVCERVMVGVKIEPERVIPAMPATEEEIVPAQEIEIFEWRCPSILAPEKETVEA